MRRLGGIDAAFLGMETHEVHAHVVAVSIYDPSTSPHDFDEDHAKRLLLSKLDKIPAFHRRLVNVPGSFTLPYWIDDPDFDIDAHVFSRQIEAPGGRMELTAALTDISERGLDRNRPQWELHVLTGLEGGRVAHALKMHHAAVDGATGVAITQTLNSLDPDDVEIGPPAIWPPDSVPSAWEMLRRGIGDTVGTARTLISVERDILGLLPRVVKAFIGSGPAPVRTVPRLSFNQAISPNRSLAYTHLDFAAVRGVSKATGTTINDVVLAICAIALRDWLTQRDELPDKSVIAGVPVSTRAATESTDSNQVTAVLAALPVHLDDPLEVLRLVAADMERQKKAIGEAPADLTEKIASLLPPIAVGIGAALVGLTRMNNFVPMPFNLGISNVPGSREPLYCTGALLVGQFGFGFFPHGAGLNITLDSHVDTFDISLMTCPDLVDNLWDLADALPAALTTLMEAVETLPAPQKAVPAKAVRAVEAPVSDKSGDAEVIVDAVSRPRKKQPVQTR
ncbi:wax ester/triacylglycerol synthase family O-acyltransferase [Gordonia rhizosphera]|uniref:Diacylglycerol O-acyltransferase n=1 Tax=Gordonia rhizosphera NBRC 16068 TaxID=1108045 RepID=K6VX87_9ACTN|nr:wax ester/triacylglycerol synthase family O-acyltransferase [Gordonia rhizosphera]GAB91535.1 hypothetical protein GORHZ_135_00850 [Gordonia rhizosphera NBRC 16068]